MKAGFDMRITKKNKEIYTNSMNRLYMWSDNSKIIEMGSNTDFVSELFEQNLEHARHVENERLTYCGCFTALIGGGLAILSGISSNALCLVLTIIFLAVSILSYSLNERWSNSFDHHIQYAKGCYYILHCNAQLCHAEAELLEKIEKDHPNLSVEELDTLLTKEIRNYKEEKLRHIQENTDILNQTEFEKYFNEEFKKQNGTKNDDTYKKCKELFSLEGCTPNGKAPLLSTLPLYCFGINNPLQRSRFAKDQYTIDTTGTKVYFKRYYQLVIGLTVIVTLYFLFASLPEFAGFLADFLERMQGIK